MRVLSGTQPSGKLHIGNYFGAMRQYVQLQEQGHECLYFIANYHALTSVNDRAELKELTTEVARGYLAVGIDPSRSIFFRQSDVPEVCELAWILSCVTPMGLLQRCVSYKEKIEQGLLPNHGLFGYPVLQAADILIYHSHLVPVGQDQKQHLEVTRDIAKRFNNEYGAVLTIPEAYILKESAVVPGLDGQKMSKSYDNTLELFEAPETTRKQIMRIVTDSTPVADPKDPEKCTVFALLSLVASEEETEQWRRRYREGGMGYGEAKARLAELMEELLEPFRRRYNELVKDPDYVEDVLREGGLKARQIAQGLMEEVRSATGIVTARE
ncbi:MAG: tryptophanyl-tRNA synthetase [Phycisphaerae bacterium SM23_30]|nr:MAG: tryptophanyl-tRNA synthetase [Phycisphaerae bacterium SM23_30]